MEALRRLAPAAPVPEHAQSPGGPGTVTKITGSAHPGQNAEGASRRPAAALTTR